jgi:hypothetical protein
MDILLVTRMFCLMLKVIGVVAEIFPCVVELPAFNLTFEGGAVGFLALFVLFASFTKSWKSKVVWTITILHSIHFTLTVSTENAR